MTGLLEIFNKFINENSGSCFLLIVDDKYIEIEEGYNSSGSVVDPCDFEFYTLLAFDSKEELESAFTAIILRNNLFREHYQDVDKIKTILNKKFDENNMSNDKVIRLN